MYTFSNEAKSPGTGQMNQYFRGFSRS